MNRYSTRLKATAFAYAALAGYVDAIGFLQSGGLFVSFMTGNSTRLAIGTGQAASALIPLLLISLFVVGVVLGRLLSEAAGSFRKGAAAIIVSVLLLAAAVLQSFDMAMLTTASLCLAMGAANTIFVRDGDVSIGVTYMTGTLVRFGHRVAEALRGGAILAGAPYFCLWLSLVTGGIIGTVLFRRTPLLCLWPAASCSIVLAAIVTSACRRSIG